MNPPMPGIPKRPKKLTPFATRLEAEMQHWGVSQSDIASRLQISQGTVSGWFIRGSSPQPRTLTALAEMFGVTPRWLIEGKGDKLNDRSKRAGEQIVKSLPEIRPSAPLPAAAVRVQQPPASYSSRIATIEIPLISWAQAGIATAFDEIPESWQERIPAAVTDSSAFAIQLRGDSMEPKFQEGDVAVVLPHTAPRNGDLVIANIKEEGFAFKILTLVGGDTRRIKLTSYNPAFPPMEFDREQFHWIYPVHSVTKMIRR